MTGDLTIPMVIARSRRLRSPEKLLYAAFAALAGPDVDPSTDSLAESVGATRENVVMVLGILEREGLVSPSGARGRKLLQIPESFYLEAGVEPPLMAPQIPAMHQSAARKVTTSTIESWFQAALVQRYGKAVAFGVWGVKERARYKLLLEALGPAQLRGVVELYVSEAAEPTAMGLAFQHETWLRRWQSKHLGRGEAPKTSARTSRASDDEWRGTKSA